MKLRNTVIRHLKWWVLPFTGLAALVWFLIRVIPKPSRATYPCQRVAFPLASGFIIWLLGLAGSAVAFHKARHALVRARYILAAVCIIASVGFIWAAMSSTDQKITYGAEDPRPANDPIGVGKGVHPGRVAWIYDPNSTSWTGADGNANPPYWYSNTCINQQVVTEMFSKALRALTGRSTDYAAWDAIFRNFNQRMGKGNVGYTRGEKIAIKVNFTLSYENNPTGERSSSLYDQIDESPQLAIALLKQLTNVAGVNPNDISIGDPGRIMPNFWYNMVGPNCPNVVYLTRPNYPLSGRTIVASDYNAPFYWSDPCSAHWAGVTTPDYIPTHFAQATYFINFPILKSHDNGGITVSGKNHYGSLIRNPWDAGYYNMHWTRATETPGMGYYRAIVELMGHPRLGGKTLLALIDGLYAGRSWDSHPIRWDMAPFNGDWPSSIFLSQDTVAADSVAYDFLYTEWDANATEINGYPHKSGAHDYLHEAALIPDPPSEANYDPNHDGGLAESLGVHEHWNNANNKQYSRNLVTGNGIELTTASPGWADLDGDWDVDFRDFARFANAWGSTTGGTNWDPNCDISMPADGVVDEKDLAVLCDNWLATLTSELVVPGAALQQVYYDASYNFEGPTWDPNSSKLFFTRRPRSSGTYQILRLDSPNNVTVWMNNAPNTNGTILSLDGRLLTADESIYQIRSHRIGASGPEDTTVLCTAPKKPNDLCQLTNGDIYFTCPDWNGVGPAGQGVYLLEPNGVVTRVNNGLYQPNGIITSLDETKLYVAESSSSDNTKKRWWVFPINTNGTLGTGSVFFKPTSPPRTNDPDGMTIDEYGNLYLTGLGGLWIVSPTGQQLKMIQVTEDCANVCFGGPENKTLYITCNYKVYSLAMCVRGGE